MKKIKRKLKPIRKKTKKNWWGILISFIGGILLVTLGILLKIGVMSIGWAVFFFVLILLAILFLGSLLLDKSLLEGLGLIGAIGVILQVIGTNGILTYIFTWLVIPMSVLGLGTFLIILGALLPLITLAMTYLIFLLINAFIKFINFLIAVFTLGHIKNAIPLVKF